jgi:hypothetical protein
LVVTLFPGQLRLAASLESSRSFLPLKIGFRACGLPCGVRSDAYADPPGR